MLVDLHVHSSKTPGCSLDPSLAIEKAEAVGLDGICFTDRNGFPLAAELPRLREQTDLAVFVGAEIATDHGYYLVFFPDPAHAPDLRQLFGPPAVGDLWSARTVVEKVREAGGVVVAAHPYDRNLERPSGDYIFTLRGLSAVEALTGTRRSNVNELAIEAADHLSLPCVGGSAALEGYDQIGTAATLFRDEVRSEAGLVEALRGGAVWAVQIGRPPKFAGDEMALGQRERGGERREERRDDRRGGGRGRGSRRGGRGGRGGRR